MNSGQTAVGLEHDSKVYEMVTRTAKKTQGTQVRHGQRAGDGFHMLYYKIDKVTLRRSGTSLVTRYDETTSVSDQDQ